MSYKYTENYSNRTIHVHVIGKDVVTVLEHGVYLPCVWFCVARSDWKLLQYDTDS